MVYIGERIKKKTFEWTEAIERAESTHD